MHENEKRTSVTLCTVEFIAESRGTTLVLTDQSAFFDGAEAPSERRSGWGRSSRLALYLHAEIPRH